MSNASMRADTSVSIGASQPDDGMELRIGTFNCGIMQEQFLSKSKQAMFDRLHGLVSKATFGTNLDLFFGCEVGGHKQGPDYAKVPFSQIFGEEFKGDFLLNYLYTYNSGEHITVELLEEPCIVQLNPTSTADPQLCVTTFRLLSRTIPLGLLVVGNLHIRTPQGKKATILFRKNTTIEAFKSLHGFCCDGVAQPVVRVLVGDTNLDLKGGVHANLIFRDGGGEQWQVHKSINGRGGDILFVNGATAEIEEISIGASYTDRGMRIDDHDAMCVAIKLKLPHICKAAASDTREVDIDPTPCIPPIPLVCETIDAFEAPVAFDTIGAFQPDVTLMHPVQVPEISPVQASSSSVASWSTMGSSDMTEVAIDLPPCIPPSGSSLNTIGAFQAAVSGSSEGAIHLASSSSAVPSNTIDVSLLGYSQLDISETPWCSTVVQPYYVEEVLSNTAVIVPPVMLDEPLATVDNTLSSETFTSRRKFGSRFFEEHKNDEDILAITDCGMTDALQLCDTPCQSASHTGDVLAIPDSGTTGALQPCDIRFEIAEPPGLENQTQATGRSSADIAWDNLIDFFDRRDYEGKGGLAIMKNLQCIIFRKKRIPLPGSEPEDNSFITSYDSLEECAMRIKATMERRETFLAAHGHSMTMRMNESIRQAFLEEVKEEYHSSADQKELQKQDKLKIDRWNKGSSQILKNKKRSRWLLELQRRCGSKQLWELISFTGVFDSQMFEEMFQFDAQTAEKDEIEKENPEKAALKRTDLLQARQMYRYARYLQRKHDNHRTLTGIEKSILANKDKIMAETNSMTQKWCHGKVHYKDGRSTEIIGGNQGSTRYLLDNYVPRTWDDIEDLP